MKLIKWLMFSVMIPASILFAQEFPAISGWTPASEVVTYQPDNLWEYIDGAADQFLAYGFQQLRMRDLSRDDVQVTVDIYDMGSPLNAFGVYTAERPQDYHPLPAGAEAVILPPSQGLMLKDQYYVKVYAFQGELTETDGQHLLTAIASELPGNDDFPAEILALPSQGKLSGSESYARESYLALSELSHCVYARYQEGENPEYQIFHLIPAPGDSPHDIRQRLGERWQITEIEGKTVLYRSVPYQGIIGIVFTEKGIWGATGASDETQLREKLKNLL